MAEMLGQVDVILKSEPGGGAGVGGAAKTVMGGMKKAIDKMSKSGNIVTRSFGKLSKVFGLGMKIFSKLMSVIMGVVKGMLGAVAALIGIFILAVVVLKKWMNELDAFIDANAKFSPAIAMAKTMKDMGKLKRQMDLARRLGPAILKMVKLQEKVKDMLVPLQQVFMLIKINVLKRVFEFLEGWMKDGKNRMIAFLNVLRAVVLFLWEAIKVIHIIIVNVLEFIKAFAERMRIYDADFDRAQEFLFQLKQVIGAGFTGVLNSIKEVQEELRNARDDQKVFDNNASLMSSLEVLTNNRWQYKTQVPGRVPGRSDLG